MENRGSQISVPLALREVSSEEEIHPKISTHDKKVHLNKDAGQDKAGRLDFLHLQFGALEAKTRKMQFVSLSSHEKYKHQRFPE